MKSLPHTPKVRYGLSRFPATSDFILIFWSLGRYVGMVMIPWRYVVKVEVEMID